MNLVRTAVFLQTIVLLVAGSHAKADVESKTFTDLVKPMLAKYCFDCHGPDIQEARLRYDQIDEFRASDRQLWTMIHQQLSQDEMPPDGELQLRVTEKEQLLAWIEREQRKLGTGSTRRLNRREVGSALRDLTGLHVDFSYSLPRDNKVLGFDIGADALQDGADSVAQLLEVTRRAVEAIRFLEPAGSKILTADLVHVEKNPHRQFEPWKAGGIKLEKLPRIAMPGMGALVEPKWPKDRVRNLFSVPPPTDRQGLVRVKFRIGLYSAFAKVPHPILWVRIGGRVLDRREVTGPMELEYQAQLEDSIIGPKGLAIAMTPRVELPYSVDGFENEDRSKPDKLPEGAGLFRPAWDKKKLKKPEQQPRPFVVLKSVELEPNFVAAWPPQQWNVDVGKLIDSPHSAERLLILWMERAFRRPVSLVERQPYFNFYKKLRDDGMTFDDALRSAFQAVLMSSPFRFLDPTAHSNHVLADHAVATRLSFMLVGSPPDRALRKLAVLGELRRPDILHSQAKRLLHDPRSYDAFVRPFVRQWLEMDQPITLVDDRRGMASYHFRRYLQDSMREETFAYFHRLLAENRPARELISSDWTMMNDSLARHYGYEGVEGGHFRKVKLRTNDKRGGGIMSHAGIQSMLCWMGDNWVIYRGAWTARHILDAPPQLPPLEVPELDSNAEDTKHMTPRELMEYHRQDKNCAVCHVKLDPIGFAFQNFDISGRWRDVEHESYFVDELDSKVAWRGIGKTRPVDTLGQLPGGEEFQDYEEFKKVVIRSYQKDIVRGLMKNLMLYATGRQPDIDDLVEIERIMHANESKGYPLQEMLLAVFQTAAFLEH